MDVFGSALLDEFNNGAAEVLWLHNSYDEPEEMPMDVFFRNEDEMPEMELEALKICKGKVLDIGAGVGSHSLVLQKRGFDVTSVEISSDACAIMKNRGLKQVVNTNIYSFIGKKYDTLLMLMNGIGLAGTIQNLPKLLLHCKSLLNDGAQIIFDSSDISYLYEGLPKPKNNYFGEICYQYEYKGNKSNWFEWLYVDKATMEDLVKRSGFKMEIICEDENDQYLARLSPLIK
ncbi:MAG: class I SAM-dependent methyltransferase [Sphingobacteriaceae bacterium]